MDRDILFRGKRTDNGKWIEGDFMKIEPPPVCFEEDKIESAEIYIVAEDERTFADWCMPRQYAMYTVDPSTVGQYTGLLDKHGNKIFEGDIVKTGKYGHDDGKGHNSAGFNTFYVVFEYGSFCLCTGWNRFNLRPDTGLEIIGNRWDNPELLNS